MINNKYNFLNGTLGYQDYKALIEKKIIYAKKNIPNN